MVAMAATMATPKAVTLLAPQTERYSQDASYSAVGSALSTFQASHAT